MHEGGVVNAEGADEARLIEEICEKQVLPCVFALLPPRIQKGVQRHFRSLQPNCPSCHTSDHVQFRYFNNKDKSCTLQPRYRCNNPECHVQQLHVFPSTTSTNCSPADSSSRKKTILFTYNGNQKKHRSSPPSSSSSSSSSSRKSRASASPDSSDTAMGFDADRCRPELLCDNVEQLRSGSQEVEVERCDPRMEYDLEIVCTSANGEMQGQDLSGAASHHNWMCGLTGFEYNINGQHECYWEAAGIGGANVTKQESALRFDQENDSDGHRFWEGDLDLYNINEQWHLPQYFVDGNNIEDMNLQMQSAETYYTHVDIPPGDDEVNAGLSDLDLTYFLIQEQGGFNDPH